MGFYLFILENISGIQDISDLAQLVTDTEFNQTVFGGRKTKDYGVDAIYIDDEERSISVFNFKYRETFKPGQHQSSNEPFISANFINALLTENTRQLQSKLKENANTIIAKLNSSDEWKLRLYVVSNDEIELQKTDESLKRLEEHYGLEIIPIGLSQICQYMSIRPGSVDAEIMLDSDTIMSFTEDSISSSKSYIIRIPISEVVRITCDNKDLRGRYSLEDLSELENAKLDYSVLFDNVRGFVLRSKFNLGVIDTLKKEPSKFFMYNNGLTLIAENIDAKPTNANKKVKLKLSGIQVLNGGQTLRTIHRFHESDKEHITTYLSQSQVLVRIFKTTDDNKLKNKIAEHTNSQNSISNVDLKSLRPEQIQLEQYLDEHKIAYTRKTGDSGQAKNDKYKHQISMERFGQILFSVNGNPHKASNQKKSIFGEYYDEVFGAKNLKIEESPKLILQYSEVKDAYKKRAKKYSYAYSDQKVFYILYIQSKSPGKVDECIDTFEKIIEGYKSEGDDPIAPARKLIQPKFKEFVDEKLSLR